MALKTCFDKEESVCNKDNYYKDNKYKSYDFVDLVGCKQYVGKDGLKAQFTAEGYKDEAEV